MLATASIVSETIAACVAITVVGTAAGVLSKTPIGRAARWVTRHVRDDRANEFTERVLEAMRAPEIATSRKREIRDVLAEPGGVVHRLTRLEAELSPNGGASTKDAVNRIAEKIGATEEPH